MKKILLIMVMLLLSGCQSNANQSVNSMFEKQESAPVENVEPNVKVYSTSGSADGYVIYVDGREKWIVTIGSVVRAHPKALVVLANGQQLEGEIRVLNSEYNFALISIKSSANIIPYELANTPSDSTKEIGGIVAKDNILQSFTSFKMVDGEIQPVIIQPAIIKQAINPKAKSILEDRQAFNSAMKDYEVIEVYDMSVLDQYEKATFTYNPDDIEQFTHLFIEDFNTFLQEGKLDEINKYIASDDLKKKLIESYSVTENVRFEVSKIKQITYADTQFIVEAVADYVTGKETSEVKIILKLILIDSEYKIISMNIIE
ncbi:hypothetical protein [Solibacillus sp. CAU 1738]|uniref:hypothetical protein n=1 Tax=Solibacillus sp. CAU 1738 TaxID=3140363 RepID=UPI00326049CD